MKLIDQLQSEEMKKTVMYMIIIFLIALLIYNANLRAIPTGDTVPASLIPISLLTKGSIVMDDFNKYYVEHSVLPYFFRETKFGYLPSYPVMTSILITPFYVVPVYLFYIIKSEPTIADWIHFAGILEKISASLITALSVSLFYLLAIRLGAFRLVALILSFAYAFASQAWSTSSQALWQHGPAVFSMILASLVALSQMDKPGTKKAILFGLVCGISIAIRPTNLLFVLPLFLLMIMRKRFSLHLIISTFSAAIVVIMLMGYNYIVFGDIRGGYTQAFSTSFWKGLSGLLFSPGRGLLVYFPLAIFGILGFYQAIIQKIRYKLFYMVLMVFVVLQIALISKWCSWWGGHSFGPRLLAEIQPMLLLLSIPCLNSSTMSCREMKSKKWLIFFIFLIWSFAIQFLGAFVYPAGNWNGTPINVDNSPERLWDWKDNPISRNFNVFFNRLKLRPLTDWKAQYEVKTKTIILLHGEMRTIPVNLTNTSTELWPNFCDSGGKYTVNLSYHIVKQDGQMVQSDGKRVALPKVIYPGDSISLMLPITAPILPGQYIVQISLVQEGVAWFHDRSVMPEIVNMTVK